MHGSQRMSRVAEPSGRRGRRLRAADAGAPAVELATDAGKAGMLVGLLVSQAAHGEPSDVVMRDLNAVRMRMAMEVVS
jgi:hypothetical protein